MAGTYSSINLHLVFSTAGRRPQIADCWREDAHAYVGGILRRMDAAALAVGGTSDHIHILAGLRTKHCAADVVKEVKLASGLWIREAQGVKPFAWQDGYGAFSVSPDHLEVVIHYIARQEEHHRLVDPRTEFLELCRQHGLAPDERFIE